MLVAHSANFHQSRVRVCCTVGRRPLILVFVVGHVFYMPLLINKRCTHSLDSRNGRVGGGIAVIAASSATRWSATRHLLPVRPTPNVRISVSVLALALVAENRCTDSTKSVSLTRFVASQPIVASSHPSLCVSRLLLLLHFRFCRLTR